MALLGVMGLVLDKQLSGLTGCNGVGIRLTKWCNGVGIR